MGRKNKYIADYNESCADCKYHHCKKSCKQKKDGKCINDGECLFTGETNKRCWERRCEHFELWRTITKK